MIKIITDKKLKEAYNIDVQTLSYACEVFFRSSFKSKRSYKINLKIVKEGSMSDNGVIEAQCYYMFNSPDNRIVMLDNLKDEKVFLKYFLHEFRHFMQSKGLHIRFNRKTYSESTYSAYRNSPLEKDVRVFMRKEKTNFIKLYYYLLNIKNKLEYSAESTQFNGYETATQ